MKKEECRMKKQNQQRRQRPDRRLTKRQRVGAAQDAAAIFKAPARAKRRGVRWPSTAFRGANDYVGVGKNCHICAVTFELMAGRRFSFLTSSKTNDIQFFS
jgi:hypothetical protein